MREIKKRLALWHIILIVGIAAIAIPVAAHVSSSAKAVVSGPQEPPDLKSVDNTNVPAAKLSRKTKLTNHSKPAAVDPSLGLRQDYYDRRRQYWEERMEGRIEEEDMDDDSGDEDKADSKEDKDDSAEKEDKERDYYEQRRNYWREQLDEDW